jgi:hypothetical protein
MTKKAPSKSETSGDWKAQKLAHVRALIQDAVPDECLGGFLDDITT